MHASVPDYTLIPYQGAFLATEHFEHDLSQGFAETTGDSMPADRAYSTPVDHPEPPGSHGTQNDLFLDCILDMSFLWGEG